MEDPILCDRQSKVEWKLYILIIGSVGPLLTRFVILETLLFLVLSFLTEI